MLTLPSQRELKAVGNQTLLCVAVATVVVRFFFFFFFFFFLVFVFSSGGTPTCFALVDLVDLVGCAPPCPHHRQTPTLSSL